MENIKTIKKINVTGTLKNLSEGEQVTFTTSDVDAQSVRSIASRIGAGAFSVNKKGSKINVSRLS